jgi:hypothetical protein
MAVTHNRYTVGTAVAQVVADSGDAQEVWLQNLGPANTSDAYAKDGYLYLLQREFTVSSPGTAIFELATGPNGAQINFYEILSTTDNLKAELVEGATVGTTGSAIAAHNLNRNASDAHATTFTAGTSISGGTVVAAEYITADKHAASGGMDSGKIFTLAPSTDYAMTFVNKGNQTTTVFFQMTFAEDFNGNNDVWVGDAVGTGVRVRGGDTVHMSLIQGQKLFAVSAQDNELMVTRQD